MMELTKAQKRMLRWAAAAGGEYRCFDGYELVTARSLECHGLARVRQRTVTLTDEGWGAARRLRGGPVNDVMIGEAT